MIISTRAQDWARSWIFGDRPDQAEFLRQRAEEIRQMNRRYRT